MSELWNAFMGLFQSITPTQVIGASMFIIGYTIWYFIPTFVAYSYHKKNRFAIFVLNWILGWTVLGWAVALVWAFLVEDHENS